MNNLTNEGILYIDENVEEIKTREYYENDDIVSIVFNTKLKYIGEEAFAGCHNLESINLPDSLIEIGAGAFFENIKLKSVKLNENLEVINEGAFLSCISLKEIVMPSKVEVIPEMCFYGCGLERITLDDNIKTINDQAFWGSEELKEVNILNPDVSIGLDVFGSCNKLKTGYIAPGYPIEMEQFDEVLYSLLALTSFDRHSDEIKEVVLEYAKENVDLLMEKIFLTNNTQALNTLVRYEVLKGNVDKYLEKAFERKQNELVALLLQVKNDEEDLEL